MLKNRAITNNPVYVAPRTVGQRVGALAMVVFILNILGLMVFAVGWLAGWFHVSAGRGEAPGQFQFRMVVNTSEVSKDVESAVDKTQKAAQTVQTVSELHTLNGQVVSYNETAKELAVADGKGGEVTVKVNDGTEVKLDGGQSALNQIQDGETVQIAYRETDHEKHAITIERTARD